MRSGFALVLSTLLALPLALSLAALEAQAQDYSSSSEEMVEQVMQRTGLSREEAERLLEERGQAVPSYEDAAGNDPGRTDLEGMNDSIPKDSGRRSLHERAGEQAPGAMLPFQYEAMTDSLDLAADELEDGPEDPIPLFGHGFFTLDEGLFSPPSFGPIPGDYLLGVGDEVVINVWGGVEFRLTRLVDRDGSIILPQVGKIDCAGKTLDKVREETLAKLARIHSSIDSDGPGQGQGGDTYVDISMGSLRGIRVFVIGEATRPGSYEVSSLSTVLGALYAAGGPSESGSLRDIRLVRQGQDVGYLDLYEYLMEGKLGGDRRLREGDTILVPGRGATVTVQGEINRPLRFESRGGETLGRLIRYAGGFTAGAAPQNIHIERIVPVAKRRPGQPDFIMMDVAFDASAMRAVGPEMVELQDGDLVTIDSINRRLENWVEVRGMVKQPGRYQFKEGMQAADLISVAGGLWPEALTERATIDRTDSNQDLLSLSFDLRTELAGDSEPMKLQAMDVLEVFSRWDVRNRATVSISGEVFESLEIDYRKGLTLRDLILKAGGLKLGANLAMAEVGRVKIEAVSSPDTVQRPIQTIEMIQVSLEEDFLTSPESFVLQPYDRVAIRKLPWWELQRTVKLTGEVFYPGKFSLERQDETISSVIARAGGLKPDAYVIGARVVRKKDNVGNIALELGRALAEPGSSYDLVLQEGDEIFVPDQLFTVKVIGEVGFPTSLIFEADKDIDYYVNRAGGYLEQADKDKSRVVWPNGMSLPNEGKSRVVAGSTIVVPIKPPPEGPTKLETMKEITAILAGLATIWLVIDNTTR